MANFKRPQQESDDEFNDELSDMKISEEDDNILSPPFSLHTTLLPGPNSPDTTSARYLTPPHPSCDQNIDPNAFPDFIRGASPPVACWATHMETEVTTEKTNKVKKTKKVKKAKRAKRESIRPISPVNPPPNPCY